MTPPVFNSIPYPANRPNYSRTTTVIDTITVTTTTVIPGGPPIRRAAARRHLDAGAGAHAALAHVVPRQTTSLPTAIPPYASGCSDNSTSYSSACSCIGVSPSTTTAPAPAVSTVISTTTTTQTITSTATTPTGTPTPNLTIQQYLNTPCTAVPDIVNVITAGQCAVTGTNNVNFGTYNPAAGCTCVVAFYYTANCSGNMVSVPPPQDPTSSQCYRYSIFFQGSVRLECTGTC
ncbi:hypothetical protein QBC37DRAFT_434983 [Rhypophila decipiens]|uniref:Uncharacterized protein n=1 Tax=Rhypophila decipiens TaxID=261697 RepID=A0AAN6XTQ1_9PEZI|nr:hypothetical protein QBC37DRAFT_434983 [Rhypophila decipiens]